MNNNILAPREIQTSLNYKEFQRETDKPFYAAYLNTASQNIFIVLRDISDRLGIKFNSNNDGKLHKLDLWNDLKENKQPELVSKIIYQLNKQFSFAHDIALNHARNKRDWAEIEILPEDYAEVLTDWIKQLVQYRNFYTHAVHKPINMHPSIFDGMYVMFDAAWRKVQERFNYEHEVVSHLVRLGENEIEKPTFQYGFKDKKGQASEKGFLFFICLWLEKKQAQELLKKHAGFKRSDSDAEQSTLDTFTYFRTRIPKPRLTSDQTEHGLFLDMVNELVRCPNELYQQLSIEDKKKFIPKDEEKELVEGEENETLSYLKRHGNRFYYFALRYLDHSFKQLKFHVDLGNYCFKTYDQEIEDEPRKRRWIKRMLSFGKLADFNEINRPKEWQEKLWKIDDGDKPDKYWRETTPHFHIEANNVGMKWIEKYDSAKVWPEISDNEGFKPRNEAPDFWMSIYELPAMAFYQVLHSENKAFVRKSAEDIIHIHKEKMTSFLSAVAKGELKVGYTKETLSKELETKGLHIHWIPSQIIDYLLAKPSTDLAQKATDRLNTMLAENNRLVSQSNRQAMHFRQKTSNKNYIALKPGRLADFLSEDMIKLQPAVQQDKGKANGTEAAILQAKLAVFEKNQHTLHETFKLCNLTDSKNPHPFLHKLDPRKCNNILEFYQKYLGLREGFLKQCLSENKYEQYHFLKLKPAMANIQALVQGQKDAVMNLPRGLFKQAILKAMEQTRDLAAELAKNDRVNVAYIIQQYVKIIKQDEPQAFYQFKRNYELLDQLYDNRKPRDRKGKEKQHFSVPELISKKDDIKSRLEKVINQKIANSKDKNIVAEARIRQKHQKQYLHFTENEKQIRLHSSCDLVLFLMIGELHSSGKSLLADQTQKKEGINLAFEQAFKLSEIMPNAEQSLLSKLTTVELKLPYGTETKQAYKTIVKEGIKIKNVGDFRALLKDRRIAGLLPYVAVEKIPYDAIKKELELFDSVRIRAFKKILALEKKAINNYAALQANKDGYIEHLEILNHIPGLTDQEQKMMNIWRKAFCHSQYPSFAMFEQVVNGKEFNAILNHASASAELRNSSIILQIENYLHSYYNRAMELIK